MGGRTASRRTGLDRATVAATALTLLDDVGLDGLTVRRLAAELGVQSPALYWHFRDKQELLDLMAQELQAALPLAPRRDDEPWPQWVARRARERRRLLLSRRDGARLVAGTAAGPAIALQAEAELRTLADAGFSPVQALRAITAIGHYTTGFVMEEQSAGQRRRPPEGPTAPEAPDGPPPDAGATPTLMAAIRDGGPPEGDEAFEQGLWMLIDGMRALLERSAAGAAPDGAPGSERRTRTSPPAR
ncbi:TetR/AcrR family transcriptional regulator C-terminal domain-containing protein [Nocardiopsis sediminis]|uniref:TetR/AcrR family transcriptional regulator C-terminal domain-containing protein n=1 Tax=Nocardiopsis sediminis TaxID=1778267 RepID=A0ABV8FTA4_9ACTN